LKGQGAVNVIGGIALPNVASVALHQSLGFKQVAQFKDVGFKLGRWWDVGYWQLQLQKPTEPTTLRKPVLK
jgi:phosphinothricin acetyltransferase